MKVQKVIHLYNRSQSTPFPPKRSAYYYLAGWASLQARECVKYDQEIKHEVWRPEPESHKTESRVVEGITCRLFPVTASKRLLKIPHLMIKELKKECQKNQVIINLHNLHNLDTMWLIFLFKNTPIFIHHHGSIPWRYKTSKGWGKSFSKKGLALVDEHVLKWVDHFSVISITEKQYIEKYTKSKNVVLEQGRKYYDKWAPLDREVARKKLGIPSHFKILMYVGYYYRLKGVDVLLEAFNKLKSEFDIGLLMVGGRRNDELYQDVRRTKGVMDYGRIPNDELKLYYSAADLYVLYSGDENLTYFGGFGTSPIEAMACNLPVVSTQLIHFPGNGRRMVGEIPENSDDLYFKIKKVLQNPSQYKPREVSHNYYDFSSIIKRNINTYKRLFERYYKNDRV